MYFKKMQLYLVNITTQSQKNQQKNLIQIKVQMIRYIQLIIFMINFVQLVENFNKLKMQNKKLKKFLRSLKVPCIYENKQYAFHIKPLEQLTRSLKNNLTYYVLNDPKYKLLSNYNNEIYKRDHTSYNLQKQLYNRVDFCENVKKTLPEVDVIIDVYQQARKKYWSKKRLKKNQIKRQKLQQQINLNNRYFFKLQLMKFLLNFLIFWITFFKAEEKECGYYGKRGDKIEQKLDECYAKNVIDNRVKMSVGFEICFGYNYKKLNDTVAEPLVHHKNIAIDEVHILQNESCRIENQKQRPTTDTGDIDYTQESQNLKECKRYFQNIINAFNDDQDTLQTYLNSNDKLIEEFFENQQAILALKNSIVQKLQSVKDCKEPEDVMKEKLIKKYLQSFLQDLESPNSSAFSSETYDVLRNPDKYATYESKNKQIPTFKNYDVSSESLLRNNEIKKRKIELKAREQELQRLIMNTQRLDDKSFKQEFEKWGLNQNDDPNDKVQVKMEIPDRHVPYNEIPFNKKTNPDLKDQTKKEVIAINNFWDKDIKIKNKRINDEDFDRYRIKGWDLNKKIKKLFKINV